MTDEETEDLCRYADDEANAGRLWRAKELLRNALAGRYRPNVYSRYGRVLLQMRDTLEAGKWLFLSGERRPEYEEAIQLYLGRFGSKGDRLYRSFPTAARLPTLDAYPEPLALELKTLGVRPRPSLTESLWLKAGCAAVSLLGFLFLLASVIAGVPIMLRWLSGIR